MGFFDSVLEENASATSGTTAKVQKKDEQDGSFLIIDESITPSDIPDTAVKLFEETPISATSSIFEEVSAQEISVTPESSIVETSIIQETPVPDAEISFFADIPAVAEVRTEVAETLTEVPVPVIASAIKEIAPATADVIVEDILSPASDIAEDTKIEAIIETPVPDVIVDNTQKTGGSSSVKKRDPNEILLKAIADLDILLADHTKIRENKNGIIIESDAQIIEAKDIEKKAIDQAKDIAKKAIDQAKDIAKKAIEQADENIQKALEESKIIDAEIDHVKQMKELFTAQLQK